MSYLYIIKLVNLFYPARCMFCRCEIDNASRGLICPDCLELYEHSAVGEVLLPGGYGKCDYALDYSGNIRLALLRFKFSGMPQYAHDLAHFMVPLVQKYTGIDFITWVPVSSLRYMRRTYDQSKLLAASVCQICGLPLVHTLVKRKYNRKQSLLSLSDRTDNVRGVYKVNHPERIHGARILLIDDIVTTGSTISECAKTLYNAGASNVICIALAHGAGNLEN